MGAALATCWLLLTAAPAVHYRIAARTETQVHSPIIGEFNTNPVVVDMLLLPNLLVQVYARRTELHAAYEPALVLGSLESDPSPELRHSAYLLGIWRADPFTELDFTEVFTYGHFPLENLGQPGTTTGLDPVVASQYVFSYTRLEVNSSLGVRRLELGADLTWIFKESVGPTSGQPPRPGEIRVPGLSGPLVKLFAQYYLTPRDLGSLELRARQARFTNHQVASTLALAPGLTHWLSPRTRIRLDAGPALMQTWGRGGPPALLEGGLDISATLYSTLTPTWPHRVVSELQVRLAPYVDDLEGSAYQRAEVELTLEWSWSNRTKLTAGLLAARALTRGPQRDNQEARLDLVYRWNLSRTVALEASAKLAWTRHLFFTYPLLQWLSSGALIVHYDYGRF